MFIHEAHILLLSKNSEVMINFTFFLSWADETGPKSVHRFYKLVLDIWLFFFSIQARALHSLQPMHEAQGTV
jgi:hypothetical protein